jgi:hypothetical protein
MPATISDAPRRITVAEFTAAMEAAVAERGRDFRYPKGREGWRTAKPDRHWPGGTPDVTCLYVRADVNEPACIIGTALHRLGFSLSELSRHEGDDVRGVLGALLIEPDELLLAAAASAQDRQDAGFSWGLALDTYKGVLARTVAA